MNEPVAHLAAVAGGLGVVVVAQRAPEHLPPAAIGDLAQFLDVDVDELTGARSFIAADDPTRRAVHPGQSIEAEADKNPVHRGRGDAQSIANASRAELEFGPQLANLGLEVRTGSMGAPLRAARAVHPAP